MNDEKGGEKRMEIEIEGELKDIVENLCKITGESPKEVISTAISVYLGGRVPKKQRFFNGRHFSLPRAYFVLFALPRHEWEKLAEWVRRKDAVEIDVGSNGEIFLLNTTKMQKRPIQP